MEKILYKCISYEGEHGTYVYDSGGYAGTHIQMLSFIENSGKSVHLFPSASHLIPWKKPPSMWRHLPKAMESGMKSNGDLNKSHFALISSFS